MSLLKFQKGNAKLKTKVETFSLPAGWSCPFALDCLSKAVVDEHGNKRIQDGPETKFRCFAASAEAMYPQTYDARKHNFDLLRAAKTSEVMAELIESSLPKVKRKPIKENYRSIVRVHVSGDFFNQKYFDAWVKVAKNNPDRLFYAYTKSVKYWVNRLDSIPPNFALTASEGGRNDELIAKHDLKFAKVVFSEEEAEKLGLVIDHDDHCAMDSEHPSFALLIHGSQPAGSEASIALSKLKKKGQTGYNKKNRK